MSSVEVYHPGLNTTAVVPEEAVQHHRQAGWVLASEHLANQASAAAASTPAKPAKDGEK